MPVIRDIPLSLKTKEILRREGISDYSKVKPEIISVLQELLATLNEEHLLEPAIAYEFYAITQVSHDRLSLENNAVLHGSLLPSVLSSAKELAAVVCTIGSALEKRATDYFSRNETLRGLLLDGIGSAAVDSLIQEVCKLIAQEASSSGYQASSPLNPGMADFPISEQWQMFQLVPSEEIGVSLTSLGVMVPLKSVSMVIGMGPEMPSWTHAEVCTRCTLKKTCHYSQAPH